MATTTPCPARSIRTSPLAWPFSIVARSRRRISAAVTSRRSDMFRRSVAAAAAASFGGEVAHQSALVLLVALDALDQIGVGGDERKIEQLGVGFLLGVDAFLLVTLERRRALDGVERFRGPEALVEDIEDVDVKVRV